MKKSLLTFLLGASLLSGVNNQLKAQVNDEKCFFTNEDNDDFHEEVFGWKTDDVGVYKDAILYYADKDNDNFHETIRVINKSENMKFITFEEFYLDKETGQVSYTIQKYQVSTFQWNNCIQNSFYKEATEGIFKKNTGYYDSNILKKNRNPQPYYRKYYQNLTAQDISALGGERFTKRFKNIVNASKSEIALKNMLKSEIYR